jgi:hypothetical protein
MRPFIIDVTFLRFCFKAPKNDFIKIILVLNFILNIYELVVERIKEYDKRFLINFKTINF